MLTNNLLRLSLGLEILCVCACSLVCDSVFPLTAAARLLCPWNFPGRNIGVGCHLLLQGIFLSQGLNLCLLHILHWQVDSLTIGPHGKPSLEIATIRWGGGNISAPRLFTVALLVAVIPSDNCKQTIAVTMIWLKHTNIGFRTLETNLRWKNTRMDEQNETMNNSCVLEATCNSLSH